MKIQYIENILFPSSSPDQTLRTSDLKNTLFFKTYDKSVENSPCHEVPHRVRRSDCAAACDQCRLTVHRLQVLHVQGAGAAGAGSGRHRWEQVGRVRATVAREQSHLVVVLCRGQAGVRGWRRGTANQVSERENEVKVSGQERGGVEANREERND